MFNINITGPKLIELQDQKVMFKISGHLQDINNEFNAKGQHEKP